MFFKSEGWFLKRSSATAAEREHIILPIYHLLNHLILRLHIFAHVKI
jgi:hypothetical protein